MAITYFVGELRTTNFLNTIIKRNFRAFFNCPKLPEAGQGDTGRILLIVKWPFNIGHWNTFVFIPSLPFKTCSISHSPFVLPMFHITHHILCITHFVQHITCYTLHMSWYRLSFCPLNWDMTDSIVFTISLVSSSLTLPVNVQQKSWYW